MSKGIVEETVYVFLFKMREVQQADNFLDAVAKARRLLVRESPNQTSALNLCNGRMWMV